MWEDDKELKQEKIEYLKRKENIIRRKLELDENIVVVKPEYPINFLNIMELPFFSIFIYIDGGKDIILMKPLSGIWHELHLDRDILAIPYYEDDEY